MNIFEKISWKNFGKSSVERYDLDSAFDKFVDIATPILIGLSILGGIVLVFFNLLFA